MLLSWGSSQGKNALLNSAEFIAGFADKGAGEVDLVLSRGTGSATFTRAGNTAYTRNSAGNWINVAANIPRSYYTASGVYMGLLMERTSTQYLGATETPATQTTASLGTGTYTLWIEGTGSATSSAGTATITGGGAATAGSPNVFTVTVAGTVTVTVSGSPTRFQLETGGAPSTYILNAGAAGTSVTRNGDSLTYPYAGNADAAVGSCYAELFSFWSAGINGLANTAVALDATVQEFLLGTTFTISASQIRIFDGTTVGFVNGSSMATASRKCASSWSTAANSKRIANSGAVGADTTYAGGFGSTAIGVGCITNGSLQFDGCIKNLRIYSTQLSASQLQAVTA